VGVKTKHNSGLFEGLTEAEKKGGRGVLSANTFTTAVQTVLTEKKKGWTLWGAQETEQSMFRNAARALEQKQSMRKYAS